MLGICASSEIRASGRRRVELNAPLLGGVMRSPSLQVPSEMVIELVVISFKVLISKLANGYNVVD